jgi:hypothetical protein
LVFDDSLKEGRIESRLVLNIDIDLIVVSYHESKIEKES